MYRIAAPQPVSWASSSYPLSGSSAPTVLTWAVGAGRGCSPSIETTVAEGSIGAGLADGAGAGVHHGGLYVLEGVATLSQDGRVESLAEAVA